MKKSIIIGEKNLTIEEIVAATQKKCDVELSQNPAFIQKTRSV